MTKKRLVCLSGLVVAVCGLCLSLSGTLRTEAPVVFADAGDASISDVMLVANQGKTSILGQLKETMRNSRPESAKEWKVVQARGAVLATLASAVMAKRSPGKGSASSWKTQVAAYAGEARKLASAAEKKNLSAADRAVKALGKSCNGCHKLHKGR